MINKSRYFLLLFKNFQCLTQNTSRNPQSLMIMKSTSNTSQLQATAARWSPDLLRSNPLHRKKTGAQHPDSDSSFQEWPCKLDLPFCVLSCDCLVLSLSFFDCVFELYSFVCMFCMNATCELDLPICAPVPRLR